MNKGTTGTTICGWCITGNHEDCKSEIVHFDKVWECSCEKCHTPVVSLEVPKQDGETDEEVVEQPIQDEETETS